MPKGYPKRKLIEVPEEVKDGRIFARRQWLDEHGGRNENDLLKDKKGKFVLMADGYGNDEKIYLPKYSMDE